MLPKLHPKTFCRILRSAVAMADQGIKSSVTDTCFSRIAARRCVRAGGVGWRGSDKDRVAAGIEVLAIDLHLLLDPLGHALITMRTSRAVPMSG